MAFVIVQVLYSTIKQSKDETEPKRSGSETEEPKKSVARRSIAAQKSSKVELVSQSIYWGQHGV